MSRIRPVVAASCLAITLLAALPGAAMAQRFAQDDPAIVRSEQVGGGLLRGAMAWGEGALAWLQAIFGEEHGQIVPKP